MVQGEEGKGWEVVMGDGHSPSTRCPGPKVKFLCSRAQSLLRAHMKLKAKRHSSPAGGRIVAHFVACLSAG